MLSVRSPRNSGESSILGELGLISHSGSVYRARCMATMACSGHPDSYLGYDHARANLCPILPAMRGRGLCAQRLFHETMGRQSLMSSDKSTRREFLLTTSSAALGAAVPLTGALPASALSNTSALPESEGPRFS